MPDSLLQMFLATAATTVGLMLAGWLLSLARRDASIVDILWGFGFVLIAWTAMFVGDGYGPREALVAGLATLWGLRLAGYLFKRNWGHGEDFRYQAMRAAHPRNFPLWSLVFVFGLQGVLMWTISLPLQVAQLDNVPSHLNAADFLAIALFAIGFTFEAVGDWQLARFKADPANRGRVMNQGLWRYTRHPNYFGDAVLWWGLFCFALARPEMAWTVVSPVIMTILLTRVSGVPMLERSLKKRRDGYDEYVRNTSGFFPLPPRKPAAAPPRLGEATDQRG